MREKHNASRGVLRQSFSPQLFTYCNRILCIGFVLLGTAICDNTPIEDEMREWIAHRDSASTPLTVTHPLLTTQSPLTIPTDESVANRTRRSDGPASRRQIHSNTLNANRPRRQGYTEYGRQPPSLPTYPVEQQQFQQQIYPQSPPSPLGYGPPPHRPAPPPPLGEFSNPPPQQFPGQQPQFQRPQQPPSPFGQRLPGGGERIIPGDRGSQFIGGPQSQQQPQSQSSRTPYKGRLVSGLDAGPAHAYYFPPRMPLPLPTCFHNPTGYACCNPMLNDLMVETYTELEARPRFHTCNINGIALMLQKRAEQRFNSSFETVAGFEDFAQKVHFNGDLVCKIELGGKYMLAYATVKNVASNFVPPDADDGSGGSAAGSIKTASDALVGSAGGRRVRRAVFGPEPELPLNHISRRHTIWI